MSYLFHSDETEADPSNKDNGDNGDNGYNGYNDYNGYNGYNGENGENGHNGDNGHDERLVMTTDIYGNILLKKEAMNTIKNTSIYINCFNFPVLYKIQMLQMMNHELSAKVIVISHRKLLYYLRTAPRQYHR